MTAEYFKSVVRQISEVLHDYAEVGEEQTQLTSFQLERHEEAPCHPWPICFQVASRGFPTNQSQTDPHGTRELHPS